MQTNDLNGSTSSNSHGITRPQNHTSLSLNLRIWPLNRQWVNRGHKSKKQRDNTKHATKNFDYTTTADRRRS